jgi:hypothetical protein
VLKRIFDTSNEEVPYKVVIKLNGTHQLLVYADDVNLLGGNIRVDNIKKNIETLIDASKEVGLKVNVDTIM